MSSVVSVEQVAEFMQQIVHQGLTGWDVQEAIEQGSHLGLALLRKEVLGTIGEGGGKDPPTLTPQITPRQSVSDLAHLEEIQRWLSGEVEPGTTQLLLRDARRRVGLIAGVWNRIAAWLIIGKVSGKTSDFARAYEESLQVRPLRSQALAQVVAGITAAMEAMKS